MTLSQGGTPLGEGVFSLVSLALALRPASHYAHPGPVASVATVVASALRRGEYAAGYRAHDAHDARRAVDVRLASGKANDVSGIPRTRSWS